MLHQLESRRLLSGEVGCALQVFPIVGSEKADVIEVVLEASEGKRGPGTFVTVHQNGEQVFREFFPADSVTGLNVLGLGGDDVLRVADRNSPIATMITGGDGNDEIYASNSAGAPGAVAFGGDGDDLIWLDSGRRTTSGHVAYGEAGDDVIYGSARGDLLYGDFDPNDPREWVLPGGNDLIYGGGGNDVIYGGGGDDELYGGDGDDYLCGCDGLDIVAGGAGYDTAMTDEFDKLSEIEHVMVAL